MTQNIEEKLILLQEKCKIDGLIDTLVNIPAGEFLYGRKKESRYLDEFYIMKYPVTVMQYRQYCNITDQQMPDEPIWGWHDSHPIVKVSWQDAVNFANFNGLLLPSNEEWEKAARGTDGRIFPWGNDWDELKCCNNESKTSPVGSFPTGVSPYGIYDMAGNVWEWCSNLYECLNGKYDNYVLKGCSWYHQDPDLFRVFTTYWSYSLLSDKEYGFRCILKL
jgi:formylglycine-generating enzyme required for sulfatase activity